MKRPLAYSCAGKVRFESMVQAQQVAKRSRRTKDGMGNRHPYRCTGCKGVHLGTLVGKRERRPRPVIEDDEVLA